MSAPSTMTLWKSEPLSPHFIDDDSSVIYEDGSLYYVATEYGVAKIEIESTDTNIESKADIATKLLNDLEQLEDLSDLMSNDGKLIFCYKTKCFSKFLLLLIISKSSIYVLKRN